MPPQPANESYSPLALISILLFALLAFAVFFVGFLVAPLLILVIFYIVFAFSDRSKRTSGTNLTAEPLNEPVEVRPAGPEETPAERATREAAIRRHSLERADIEAARYPSDG